MNENFLSGVLCAEEASDRRAARSSRREVGLSGSATSLQRHVPDGCRRCQRRLVAHMRRQQQWLWRHADRRTASTDSCKRWQMQAGEVWSQVAAAATSSVLQVPRRCPVGSTPLYRFQHRRLEREGLRAVPKQC